MILHNHDTLWASATSTVVAIVLVLVVLVMAHVPGNQERIIDIVTANAVRLEALEQKRSPATSKRFNSDDARDLIKCIKTTYAERYQCLDDIVTRLDDRER